LTRGNHTDQSPESASCSEKKAKNIINRVARQALAAEVSHGQLSRHRSFQFHCPKSCLIIGLNRAILIVCCLPCSTWHVKAELVTQVGASAYFRAQANFNPGGLRIDIQYFKEQEEEQLQDAQRLLIKQRSRPSIMQV
jgi:hypothetical protein